MFVQRTECGFPTYGRRVIGLEELTFKRDVAYILKNPEGTGEVKNAGRLFSSINNEVYWKEFSLKTRGEKYVQGKRRKYP